MNAQTKIISLTLSLMIIGGLAVYGFFSAVPEAKEGENTPVIEIMPEIFDFGEVSFGDVVSYDFTVKNTGNEVLEIKRVATSCSCATAEIKEKTINPDEEVKLSVFYDSGVMGAYGTGEQERIIYVRSSDPNNPQVEVKIYANVN